LLRHKQHVAQAIVKAADPQEQNHALDLLGEAERVGRKAWELQGKMESGRDHRGSVVALREVRPCLETLGEMLSLAPNGIDLTVIPDDVLLVEAERRGLKMPYTFAWSTTESEPKTKPADLRVL
jgi:hypothetical protein